MADKNLEFHSWRKRRRTVQVSDPGLTDSVSVHDSEVEASKTLQRHGPDNPSQGNVERA